MISRPSHGGFVHHLGATARAVIRDAGCPVLVVPAAGRDRRASSASDAESAMTP